MTEEPQGEAFVTIFDDTYDQPDCRAYFRMMDALGYRNQHHATGRFAPGSTLCAVPAGSPRRACSISRRVTES